MEAKGLCLVPGRAGGYFAIKGSDEAPIVKGIATALRLYEATK